MAQVLQGKPVAQELNNRIAQGVQQLHDAGVQPTLALVRVGSRPDDVSYERSILKRAEALGIVARSVVLDEATTTEAVIACLHAINDDDSIHACLMFRPLPAHLDEKRICDALTPTKDIDAISAAALAAVFTDTIEEEGSFAPSTAQACIEMLDYYGIELEGKTVAVVGRSLVIGKPVAMLALKRNATVTLCHSRTRNLSEVMQAADVVICATGRPRAYGADCFAHGQTVLDVGICVDENGNLCGDVDFAAVEPVVSALTPVPGGIGSVTTAITMLHTVEAAQRACGC